MSKTPIYRAASDISEKVTAGTAAAAVATIGIWAIESGFAIDLPAAVEVAVVTVLVAIAGYLIPERR